MWMSDARLRTPWMRMRLTTWTIGAFSSTSSAMVVGLLLADVDQLEGLDVLVGHRQRVVGLVEQPDDVADATRSSGGCFLQCSVSSSIASMLSGYR